LPKAVLVVDVCGQCADWGPIREICGRFGVHTIEDAAESLGATYGGRPAGTLADIGCFSFNGNKIITTSGGGMLVTENAAWASAARHLATQARDPAPHYEHSLVGYNYRLSNLLAAIGRGQLAVLDDRVAKRRDNFDFYRRAMHDIPGITFMPEASFGRATRWLTCLLIDPEVHAISPNEIGAAMAAEHIEARPMWKPMHRQPVFSCHRVRGGRVADKIFRRGLCLPSGSTLSEHDRNRVVWTFGSILAAKQMSFAA
jgi:dTDP-4-amino-4,6-dideoxygalactose transaminase